jgi:hypothetical protein
VPTQGTVDEAQNGVLKFPVFCFEIKKHKTFVCLFVSTWNVCVGEHGCSNTQHNRTCGRITTKQNIKQTNFVFFFSFVFFPSFLFVLSNLPGIERVPRRSASSTSCASVATCGKKCAAQQ